MIAIAHLSTSSPISSSCLRGCVQGTIGAGLGPKVTGLLMIAMLSEVKGGGGGGEGSDTLDIGWTSSHLPPSLYLLTLYSLRNEVRMDSDGTQTTPIHPP